MKIDVKIPYSETGQLAEAYNEALTEGTSEWVLFLDHDVFLCNPRWYEMSLKAIETLKTDPKAFCVGCVAGGSTKSTRSQLKILHNIDSIDEHIKKAKQLYARYGNTLQPRETHVTGFFLLMNRQKAQEIGFRQFIPGNINKIDVDFGTRGLAAGYHNYAMPGLYVYHRKGMRFLKKEFITK